jgi:hypothetical protein
MIKSVKGATTATAEVEWSPHTQWIGMIDSLDCESSRNLHAWQIDAVFNAVLDLSILQFPNPKERKDQSHVVPPEDFVTPHT